MKATLVVVAVLGVAALGIGIALLLQPRPEVPLDDNSETIIANETEPERKDVISVTSSRSAFPFVQRWVSQYNNDEGSLARAEVIYYIVEADRESDLTIIDDGQDIAGSRDIPVSAHAAAIVYNIPGFPDIPSGLRLNASVLSSILNGTITMWNDPALEDLNVGLNLPSERIVVVNERSTSSSLRLVERYLSDEISWPRNSIGVLGPDELAATVRQTPYSVGYVDFSYATQTRMTFAALANQHGDFLIPSSNSIHQAVNSSIQLQNITGTLTPPLMNASMFGNGSYPVTGLYYASIPEDASNGTIDFVRWVIGEGQQTLDEVQYPALYQNESLATYAETVINNSAPKGT